MCTGIPGGPGVVVVEGLRALSIGGGVADRQQGAAAGITTLARMVAEVRREENDRLYATL
jgi:hypothetical protein